ncbi:MAG: TauD/TfdA family dioxygenase, partial [Proteobacteria bacterium]|nr:TauD/TfdA family dioxygenase [Pseudomonadota bacterium]
KEPNAETIEAVEEAMAEYAVIVLRDQHITDEQQIAWSRHFGPRESPSGPISAFGSGGYRLPQYLFDASNLDLNGEILPPDHPRRAMRGGDRLWHTDSSFNPLPTKWSMLSSRIVPPQGADTEFADARAAYDALDDEMKSKIDGLIAIHDICYSRKLGGLEEITDALRQAQPPANQPLVRTIPRSGRRALLVGAHAESIVGMDYAEGNRLLRELTDFATQSQFVYSHAWRTGDLVIWDNRCTLHRATPFDDMTYKRDMRRTTVDEFAPAWAAVG